MALTLRFATDTFRLADVEGRGWLPDEAVIDIIDALGFELSDNERGAMARAMDPGATGRIELAEFEHAIGRRLAAPDSPEELAAFCRLVDSAETGVSYGELHETLARDDVQADPQELRRAIDLVTDGASLSAEHWRSVLMAKSSATRRSTKY